MTIPANTAPTPAPSGTPRGLIIQHERSDPAGLLGTWLSDHGIPYEVVEAYSDRVPVDTGDYGFVVSLGYSNSVYDESTPWLDDELRLLRRCVGDDGAAPVPVLGICFGGQLLGRALGADVWRNPDIEIGWLPVQALYPERVPPGPYPHWHHDAFDLPEGAVPLAMRGRECQAFLHGRALGVQFHPEADPEIFQSWIDDWGVARLRDAGFDPEQLREQASESAAPASAAAAQLFDFFFRDISGFPNPVPGEVRSADQRPGQDQTRPAQHGRTLT